ncbi:S9 family peptidase [Pseudidiomarina sp. 1APR75-33.1]|uniref:S9 family peptidase n=1 Tax=Pseudidiomarina terrestris TaxID=2820060 RepID=UPI00264B7985|nr:prolyl oligopeptidase family serine peptidase [Pseudidiomarina sp. 1APR75-33.1]MDN7126583.1 S9 family peptidase [Pseudidiomarina sp. 1APR75-33.1]
MKTKFTVSILAAFIAASCAATDVAGTSGSSATTTAPETLSLADGNTSSAVETGELTIKQIMSDQDWVARSPSSAYWLLDGTGVLYQQKRENSVISDWFHLPLDKENAHKVPVDRLHNYAYSDGVYNDDRSLLAYSFEGNVFVRDMESGDVRQLTRDEARQSQLTFLNDGRLSYRQGNDFFVVDPQSGLTAQVASLATRNKPEAVAEPKDFVAREQVELIEFVQKERRDRQERADYRAELTNENPSLAPQSFYLGENKQIVAASLSPAGDKLIVAITDPQSWRDDGDIMPNYVAESGRVEAESVRRRVADAKPVDHQLLLLDLETGEQTPFTYNTLPGWNEDVLAEVKAENYAAQGKDYESEQAPRPITLMQDWGWESGAIRWSATGENAIVMLEAWDNKDRWIASVDFAGKQLVNQHRLHDDAWINYTHNEFGFLPNSDDRIWYQSEEDGYAHLYTQRLGGNQQQLTSGKFVTESPAVDAQTQSIYFTANASHPGVYELYRVNYESGETEQLTDLDGMVESFELSPGGDQVVFSYSSALQPSELYVQSLLSSASAKRLTHTATEQFNSFDWSVPEIVPVPSSNVDEPIYTRVYYPDDYDPNRAEKYPAVVFIHGAGYLQNAHAGWSNYQREFMFHTFLNRQGYVVLDLDYRGSKGYGRDWRTAIYRNMGWPEVEDLVDVVQWAGENTNVDTDRMGTYGGSYGGFLTFMALFNEPGLFKAGAALRPVSDWAHYNTGYTSNILNLPDDDPIAYRRSSPIYFTEGLQDALLINSPMVDDNVFFQDSVRLVQRLIEHEKEDFETAIFPVEPHGFRQPSSWLDEYRRIYELFEENLK